MTEFVRYLAVVIDVFDMEYRLARRQEGFQLAAFAEYDTLFVNGPIEPGLERGGLLHIIFEADRQAAGMGLAGQETIVVQWVLRAEARPLSC